MEDVRRIHEDWGRAWLAKDAATVAAIMSADFAYVGPNGQAFDRTAMLFVVQHPSYHVTRGSRTDVSLRALGPDAVLVRDRWQGSGTFNGQSFVDDHTCSFLYERTANGWQLVLEHCTARAKLGAGPT